MSDNAINWLQDPPVGCIFEIQMEMRVGVDSRPPTDRELVDMAFTDGAYYGERVRILCAERIFMHKVRLRLVHIVDEDKWRRLRPRKRVPTTLLLPITPQPLNFAGQRW